ncbi:MAG: AAA family ATPase [Rubrivivax sp.]
MTARALIAGELAPAGAELPPDYDQAQAGEDAPIVGQPRAAAAVRFALAMDPPGYHVFVMGPPGSGRRTLVRQAVAAHVAGNGVQRSDWAYVNNFQEPHKPVALQLPAGRGARLRADMQTLVRDLRAMISSVFESEEYAIEVDRINTEYKERAEKALFEVAQEAQKRGLAITRTPLGLSVTPQKDGEVMPPADFEALPEAERERLRQGMVEVQEQLERVLRQSMRFRKEHADRVRELNHSMTRMAVDHAIEDIRARHADLPRVAAWLDTLCADVIEHAQGFRGGESEDGEQGPGEAGAAADLSRYEVNLILDASAPDGGPVVKADLPTHANLVGRIDHIARFGMLVTDFRLIKGGLLHKANGGFLLIDALKLLTQPFAWPMLKRALLRGEIRIEPMAELFGAISTVQLEPEPIPLKLKVALVGEREICELLRRLDEEFDQLFRVVAAGGDDLAREGETAAALARSLAAQARGAGLLPVAAPAMAATLAHGARLAEDASRITGQVRRLLDLLKEADRFARDAGRESILAEDVRAAATARRERASRADERIRDAVLREVLLVDTAGERVGQINALAVHELAGERFGSVMRVTATSRLGDGEVIDIQRETRTGGPLHAKGVMILSAFLASRYSRLRDHPIRATLVFEQSYGYVEGDSASLAETVALLSSIAGVPVRQNLAVTGSVNQLGDVQAIGGVNEKIEGFFDLCAARGLDGRQGVVIPAANAAHLMLRDDVVEAVAQGRFAVHVVQTVDDAVELLTGVPAGHPGRPDDESVNGRIARRLQQFTLVRRGGARGMVGREIRRRGNAG